MTPHTTSCLLYNSTNMFNTGDIAILREDGELEYVGRIDEQVKINVSRQSCCGNDTSD